MHGQIWRFAVPMILSNLSVPLLGAVDTAVVGHLEESYHIGAVAIGAMLFGIVFWGFGFLRMGTTGITAQIYGQRDMAELRLALIRGVLTAILISLVLMVFRNTIADIAFYFIEATENVATNARIYFEIRIMSSPASLINYVLLGWFLGMQNAKFALYHMLFVNSINMILDYLFVVKFGQSANGVAWASLIAEYSGLIVGALLVKHVLRRHPGTWVWQGLLDKNKIIHLVLVNKNIFIRTLSLMFTLAYFTAQGSKMGELILATNALLINFQTFMAYGLDGLAHAAEAMVGRAVGERNKSLFHSSVLIILFWAVVASLCFAVLFALFGNGIIALLTDIDAVRESASNYLIWVVILPIVSVWSFVFDGVYIGATRVVEMRNIMLLATFGFFLPSWYLLQGWGNHGLWLAFVIFMIARGMIMLVVFLRIQRQHGFIADVCGNTVNRSLD